MIHKTSLDNGLKVATYSMPKMHSVALGVWVRVGGRHENSYHKGMSHYLEHMVFKGTKKYSCRRLKESIEGVGGVLNGFTSEETTCYLAKLPKRYLDKALDVLSEMVISPLIAALDVEKERTVILEEIKMYQDLPQSYVNELLDELLWPEQPLGQSILGTVDSVSRISREDLSNFKEVHYSTRNVVVSAAGAFSHTELVKKIRSKFSSVSRGERNTFPGAKEEQSKPNLKILNKDTEQTHLALGFHGFRRDHPAKYALDLLHVIMGGNMSSRLFNEVREKNGLAYEIGSAVKRFNDTGVFLVHAGIDNRKALQAVKLILAELGKPKEELVSHDELRRAKDFCLGQLALSLEDTMDNMLWLGESMLCLDKIYTLPEIINGINSVTRQDVRKVAQTILQRDHLNLALIGPLKKEEDSFYQQLKV